MKKVSVLVRAAVEGVVEIVVEVYSAVPVGGQA